MLSDPQREFLLRVARQSIAGLFQGERDDHPAAVKPFPDVSGVFVTIKRRGELRGCLGVLQMRGRLDEEVAHCARDAATEDPRFPPLEAPELSEVRVEISVLGPLEEIDPRTEQAIVIGRHGLVVQHGTRRGLLLPQVATEWGWTPEQFLRQTCRKAGLALDAWEGEARVFRFEAEVFGE